MTTWAPEIGKVEGPLYLAIAELMARDIKEGRLPAGSRLPTHRDLARTLGVTVGTVTRGYEEARRRGLVSGEVGRGTFVRSPRGGSMLSLEGHATPSAGVDLSLNHPSLRMGIGAFEEAVAALAASAPLADVLQYQSHAGMQRHREAGAGLLRSRGLSAEADDVIVTSGAQHGMLLAFSILSDPADVVLTEELTYPGMKNLGRLFRLRLEGLPLDDEGIEPSALDAACRALRPRVLYCTPTLQNPTGRVMSAARREAIAAIVREHRLTIVEDDIYGFLLEDGPPPISTHCPELAYYVTSLSKSLAPGLRVGFLRAPRATLPRLSAAAMTTTVMASPFCAELATRMLESGAAAALVARQRREIAARQALARKLVGRYAAPGGSELSPHLWMQLPEPWRAEEFAAQARELGVGIATAETFAVGRGAAPHAIRVSLGAAPDEASLDEGLRILARVAGSAPQPLRAGV